MTGRGWLGVVSAEHVMRGVTLGIAQVNHGKRAPLARMRAGDVLVYYSPRTSMAGGDPVQAFTAIGTFPDDELWQADDGDWQPWRRRVDYATDARRLPVADVRDRLDLTAGPNWGYALRRGLLPLSENDTALLVATMTGAPLAAAPQPAGLW